MLCDYKIIKKENYQTNEWVGGKTTQFNIYPEDSNYQDRNFIWRLSSATVETESSVFTSLPDYNRILMVLEGKLELNHNDIEIIHLNAFDQNLFDGSANTKCLGKAVDFNLMMRKDKCTGKIKAISINKREKSTINEIIGYYNNKFTFVVYVYKSNIELSIDDDAKLLLNQGDILFIDLKEQVANFKLDIENQSDEEANVIITQIFY
jgi:environmental stress-induced protein Ves